METKGVNHHRVVKLKAVIRHCCHKEAQGMDKHRRFRPEWVTTQDCHTRRLVRELTTYAHLAGLPEVGPVSARVEQDLDAIGPKLLDEAQKHVDQAELVVHPMQVMQDMEAIAWRWARVTKSPGAMAP